jgi:peflin
LIPTFRHAEPEEAAQAISRLQDRRRSSHPAPANSLPTPPKTDTPPATAGRGRVSPNNNQQQPFRPNQSVNAQYAQQSFAQNRLNSPPPQNYGQGPRPNIAAQQRPLVQNRPPRTPLPPQTPDESDLFPLFRAANISGSGSLSEKELSSALVNADYTSFDPFTIKCLLRMFSSTPTKSYITYEEFVNLWRFLAAWRELFEKFDEDRSGRINLQEFGKALLAFGYRLSHPFTAVLYNSYNDRGGMGRGREGMSFDLFVQACISLKRMTDVFKGYDDDRDGYVTLSFEEFLTEILRLRE